jgi:hypothetical protein
MNNYTQKILELRKLLGSYDAVGKACGGISGKAIMKWRDRGRPPRTEYTGETQYASMLEDATQGVVKAADLLPAIDSIKLNVNVQTMVVD